MIKSKALDRLILILIPIIALILYSLVLIVPFSSEVGLAARYGSSIVLIIVFLLLYPAYQMNGWPGILVSFSGTIILFALPLAGVWNSGISEANILGGVIPWSDANGYYVDASQTLEGRHFSTFSSRRPLFAALLTFLLGITQENLQFSIAILVLMTAVACFFCTREIQRSHGTFAALFVLTLVFIFYRRFAGTILTTNLGMPLGLIGFSILWRGASQEQINLCLFGTFLLTLALNARAGAFFILPAIIIWGIFYFRSQNRFSLHFLIGGISAVFLGFLLNQITLKVFGHPDGVAFSNFAHTFYGLVVGGKSWTQIYVDHPGVQEHEMYPLAFEALRQNPFGLVIGIFKAWQDYFNPEAFGAFSFVRFYHGRYPVTTHRIHQVLYWLSYLSFLGCCYRWRKSTNSLMIALTLGIVLSVPFVPPSDADIMRAYAATIPISAALPALVFTPFFRAVKLNLLLKTPSLDLEFKVPCFFGLALVFLCFIAPIATQIVSKPSQFIEVSCPNHVEPLYMKFRSGSVVQLVDDRALQRTHLPDIRLSDFRNGLAVFGNIYSELTEELQQLGHSTTIMSGSDLKTSRFMILIAESRMMPANNAIIGICEQTDINPALKKYNFLVADSIETVRLQ